MCAIRHQTHSTNSLSKCLSRISQVKYEICTNVKLNDIDGGAESLDKCEVEDDDEVDCDGRDRGGDLEDEEGGE